MQLVDGVYSKSMLREYLLEASNGLCEICGRALALAEATLDHIIPKSRGGLDELANLQIAHGPCNWIKGDRLQDEITPATIVEEVALGQKHQKQHYFNRTGRRRGRI